VFKEWAGAFGAYLGQLLGELMAWFNALPEWMQWLLVGMLLPLSGFPLIMKAWSKVPKGVKDALHLTLDLLGLIPGLGAIADVVNSILYFAEGDVVSGLLSLVFAIPGLGDVAAGVKLLKDFGKLVKELGPDALKLMRLLTKSDLKDIMKAAAHGGAIDGGKDLLKALLKDGVLKLSRGEIEAIWETALKKGIAEGLRELMDKLLRKAGRYADEVADEAAPRVPHVDGNKPPRDRDQHRPKDGDQDKPPRSDGNDKPPAKDGGNDKPPPKEGGNDKPPPKDHGNDKPPPKEGGNDKPPPKDHGNDKPPPKDHGNDKPPKDPDRPPRDGVDDYPRDWSRFDPDGHTEFRTRLREFRGTDELSSSGGLAGGEGQVYLSDRHPDLGLKRWFASRLDDMAKSIRLLEEVRAAVLRNPTLARDLDVVRIHERGRDWMVRDFDRSSIPLRDTLDDPDIAAAHARVLQELEAMKRRGELPEVLETALKRLRRNPPSANIHWSPTSGKLLIIDMM